MAVVVSLVSPLLKHRSGIVAVLIAFIGMATGSAQAQSATTTALAVSPASPQSVGAIETLTATVTVSGTATRAPGRVVFCDDASLAAANNGFCGVLAQLGTAQITSSGSAVLKVRLSPGTHTLYAKFLGTPGVASPSTNASNLSASTSLTSTPGAADTGGVSFTVNVTALTYPVVSVLSVTGSTSAGYSLANTLVTSPAATVPAGTGLSFYDTGASLRLGTATYGSTGSTVTFSPGAVYNTTSFPSTSETGARLVLKGDFNNDGIQDLFVCGNGTGICTTFLGNGDGTFTAQTAINLGHSPVYGVVGDFNNDGYQDLAFVTANNYGVYVLMNKGAGGFGSSGTGFTVTAASPFDSGTISERGIALGDFNGDGNLDLAIGAYNSAAGNGYQVFTGNGDGTFTASTSMEASTTNPVYGLVAADLNSDGYTDLLLTTYVSSVTTPYLYLSSAAPITSTATPLGTAAGTPGENIALVDLKNDGVLDAVYESSSTMNLYVNSGTSPYFSVNTTTAMTNAVSSVAVSAGDINNDGCPDVVGGTTLGTIAAFTNTGTAGSCLAGLTAPVYYTSVPGVTTGLTVYSTAIADFTGSGLSDVAAADYTAIIGNTQPFSVLFSGYQTTSSTLSNVVPTNAGIRTVDSVTTSSNYANLTSNTEPLVGGQLSLTASPANSATVGASVTLSAAVSPATVTSVGTAPTGTVTFYDGTTSLGTGTFSSGTATFTTSALAYGTHSLTAQYAGDSNYPYSATYPLISAAIPFQVTAGAASKVVYLTSPASSISSGGNAGMFSAAIEDSSGNIVTSSSDSLQVLISTTNQTGAATAVNGVASFDLTAYPLYSYNATSYTLTLSDTTTTGLTTATANVTVSAPAHLYVVTSYADTTGTCTDQNSSGATLDAACTLRSALALAEISANSGSTITFSNAKAGGTWPQTITMTGAYFGSAIAYPTNIYGPGPANLFITGNVASKYYIFKEATAFAGTFNVSGMTLQNGSAGSSGYGGAFYITGTSAASSTVINNVAFLNNTGSSYGGAIYVAGNTATSGASPAALDTGATLTINNCYFSGNSALNDGGAIDATAGAGVTITNSYFYNNSAGSGGYGGAVSLNNSVYNSSNVLMNDTFYHNTAGTGSSSNDYGGGVYLSGATGINLYAALVNDTIVGNSTSTTSTSTNGGGVYASGTAYPYVVNSIIEDNSISSTTSGKYADFVSTAANTTSRTSLTSSGANTYTSLYTTLTALGLSDPANYGGPTTYNGTTSTPIPTAVVMPASPALRTGSPTTATLTTNPTATISNYSIYNNVGSFYLNATNDFYPGEVLTLSAFGTSTFLNGQTVTVASGEYGTKFFTGTLSGTNTNNPTSTISITKYAIASNVITLTYAATTAPAANTLITLSGFPTSTFLNGQVLVIATGATTTSATAPFTNANVTTTTESGVGSTMVAEAGKATGVAVVTNVTPPSTDARGISRPTTGTNTVDMGATQSNLVLAFVDQPSSTTTGSTITSTGSAGYPAVQLSENGHNVQGSASVSIALDPGTLSGTTTVSTVDTGTQSTSGIATFSALSSTVPESSTVLDATSGTGANIYGATSSAFSLAGSASQLVFLTKPTVSISSGNSSANFTVQEQDSSGNVTGTVPVYLTITGPGSYSYSTSVTPSSGSAIFSGLPALTTPGTYTYTASASGLSSAAVNETVTINTTALMLAVTPSTTEPYGTEVTLTATLSPYSQGAASTNSEIVTFKSNGTIVGTGTLANGVATLSTAGLNIGTDSLTASYAGDTSFSASTSTAMSETSTPASFAAIRSGTPVTVTLTFTNNFTMGSTSPGIATSGTANSPFAITGGTCTANTAYGPATTSSCTVTVTYTPGGSTGGGFITGTVQAFDTNSVLQGASNVTVSRYR